MNPTDLVDRGSLRDDVPAFNPGDTVKVHVRVVEGTRERLQVFQGVVIRRQGSGVRETFTVRKVSFGVGVERTFPVHSPIIGKIEVDRLGDVRRAKLYYLRDLRGKAAKIKENERDAGGDARRLAVDSSGVKTARRRCVETASPARRGGVVIAVLLRAFVAQAFRIPSASMVPQLEVGDRVVVSRLAYDVHDPRRGDIVVFDCPPAAGCGQKGDDALPVRAIKTLAEALLLRQPDVEEFIKRVIGLPGDVVSGHDGHVWINDHLLVEPYLPKGTHHVRLRSDQGRQGSALGDGRQPHELGRQPRLRPDRAAHDRGPRHPCGVATPARVASCREPRSTVLHLVPGSEDVERYEAEVELQLYKEYKDVIPMFTYVVETERRFYLANSVDQQVRDEDGRSRIELTLHDAWVWDMYRQSRFVSTVRVVTYKDVNVEELPKKEL